MKIFQFSQSRAAGYLGEPAIAEGQALATLQSIAQK
jgi:hypothetical protein